MPHRQEKGQQLPVKGAVFPLSVPELFTEKEQRLPGARDPLLTHCTHCVVRGIGGEGYRGRRDRVCQHSSLGESSFSVLKCLDHLRRPVHSIIVPLALQGIVQGVHDMSSVWNKSVVEIDHA